jgi:signal transduction histidine kinase
LVILNRTAATHNPGFRGSTDKARRKSCRAADYSPAISLYKDTMWKMLPPGPRDFTTTIVQWIEAQPKYRIMIFSIALIPIIAIRISLLPVFLVPVFISTWFVSANGGFVVAFLCVVSIPLVNFALSLNHPSEITTLENAAVRYTVFAAFILVSSRLRSLQLNLQDLVKKKTSELTQEILERRALERKMQNITEREQKRIAQDLHDGLCQHLTGTAIAAHLLTERLQEQGLKEASDAEKIYKLTLQANAQARGIAKGLYPVELQPDGLMRALEEFAATTSELFGNRCIFECHSPIVINSPEVATQLFRIAQEAVSNAIRHGRANQIAITLECEENDLIKLEISDNGSGIPVVKPVTRNGMGLRIMAERSRKIGGKFSVKSSARGSVVNCLIPQQFADAVDVHG